MSKYLVRAAYRRGQELTVKQRTSSHFTMEPRVGIHTIRLDHPVTLTEAEMEGYEAELKQLLEAEAIEIVPLDAPAGTVIKSAVAPVPEGPSNVMFSAVSGEGLPPEQLMPAEPVAEQPPVEPPPTEPVVETPAPAPEAPPVEPTPEPVVEAPAKPAVKPSSKKQGK